MTQPSKPLASYNGSAGGRVTYNGNPLPMTPEGRRSSPTGFSWGYMGSGPYALAHSILRHACGRHAAHQYAMQYKFKVIAELPFGQPFELKRKDVAAWVKAQRGRGAA